MPQRKKTKRKRNRVAPPAPPSLKSTSGAGFSFEDKVAARLMCEMLSAQPSLAPMWGVVERLERQAADWEPFDDLLLTVRDANQKPAACGCSIKSNRQISANGCGAEMRDGAWATIRKPAFDLAEDKIALFCAKLSVSVSEHMHVLCRQARELEPARMDEKIVHGALRKIYDSFSDPKTPGDGGLPGHLLSRFILREFDFEEVASRDEAEALRLCREILRPDETTDVAHGELWQALLRIAEALRVSGGAVSRNELAAKLRHKFRLRDDAQDLAAWTRVRQLSHEAMDEIETSLPGGLALPRTTVRADVSATLASSGALTLLGETGSGKSAVAKLHAIAVAAAGAEVMWIKAERFVAWRTSIPSLAEMAARFRRSAGLLVIDAVEGCYDEATLRSLAKLVATVAFGNESPWHVIITCQTPEWPRVRQVMVRELAAHPAIARQIQCEELSTEDFDLVCAASPSVPRLAGLPQMRRLLSSPKLLDVLLSGQLAEERTLAGEADLVEWWWEQQVRGSQPLAAEERVARTLAARMADELCTELPPDSAASAEEAASTLLRRRVLRRTHEGRLRFDHEVLADWSRVMHLRSLGADALAFMRLHAENPPWLRAIRLLSQHLLERSAELDRWREVVEACFAVRQGANEPAAESMQVGDAWLEGIAFCVQPEFAFANVSNELFANDAVLLQRLIWRLLHTATFPDPVVQERLRQLDVDTAEVAATNYRLPILSIWMPVLRFLLSHPEEATGGLAVEIAALSAMWSRMADYLGRPWEELAGLALLNAEKEFRGEVAGDYRYDRRPDRHATGRDARVTIYIGGLQAASQHPDRAAKLVLKAAGRAPWDAGDTTESTDVKWLGEWDDWSHPFQGRHPEYPITSWPSGPMRRTSDDFFHAWFDSGEALRLYQVRSGPACEATLAFLLEWPKHGVDRTDRTGIDADRHGFTFEADHLFPPFYTKGPFLAFLRADWQPALKLIIQLVNFAAERVFDWLIEDPDGRVGVTIETARGTVFWRGHSQAYCWHRYHQHTAQVVTCALMAFEKWMDESLAANTAVSEPIRMLFEEGRSIAFAGVLISIAKRNPALFLSELKPFLFVRQFHWWDQGAVANEFSALDSWIHDPPLLNQHRREWNALPGRRESLLELCRKWLIVVPEFEPILAEVSAAWRKEAEKLPTDSETRAVTLRWAYSFERSNWKEVALPDGRTVWKLESPEELRDVEGEATLARQQALLTLPTQCKQWLARRQVLSDEQAGMIWRQLHDWTVFEENAEADTADKDDFASALFDHRHARAGLLAVLLCLCDEWVRQSPERRQWLEEETCKLLADPPKVRAFVAEETSEDGEGFLARCAVRFWAQVPMDSNWRMRAGRFITAFRYSTVAALLDEAFRARGAFGVVFRELEALALAFAATRQRANRLTYDRPDAATVELWRDEALPAFATGKGPAWPERWQEIEAMEPPEVDPAWLRTHPRPRKRHRRSYGFDMGVVLAAFGQRPQLNEASDIAEREHWMGITRELLNAFLRTLPIEASGEGEDWGYDIWRTDEKILESVAARVFESTPEERVALWKPVLELPPPAYHHVEQFLRCVLLESMRTEPPSVATLLPIWREMAGFLFAAPRWRARRERGCREVWQHIFLYGTPFTCMGDACFAPLVAGLRNLFEAHIRAVGTDVYDQARLVMFLTKDAGKQLLVESFAWLGSTWEQAGAWFWQSAAQHSEFSALLECAWKEHFPALRQNVESLKAFKTLALQLATQQVPIALEVQRRVIESR